MIGGSGRSHGWLGDNGLRVFIVGFLLAFAAGARIPLGQFSELPGSPFERPTTMTRHMVAAEKIDRGEIYAPHSLFHRIINVAEAVGLGRETGAIALLGFATATAWAFSYWFARSRLWTDYTAQMCGLIAGLTLVVNAVYVPWLTPRVYLGQWGPNVYHNPTHTLVLAFAVPLFVFVGKVFGTRSDGRAYATAGAASVALCVSIYAKPTFMIILAPATVVYAALFAGISRRTAGLLIVLLAVPTFCLLYVWYLASTEPNSQLAGGGNTVAPFYVWSRWSRNIPYSIVSVLAFPVVLGLSARREHVFGRHFVFAWILVAIAFVLAAMLVEVRPDGKWRTAANWFSGYLLANHLLFLSAIVEYFAWRKSLVPQARRRFRYVLCTVLLILHTVSGVAYIVRLQYISGPSA